MERSYAEVYRTLHERHWWWRAREAHLVGWLERLRPAGGFGPILDVGCGAALWFDRLRAFGDPEGVEGDAALAAAAAERDRARVYAQPFDEHFRPGKRYGLVLMLDVLEHLPDDRAAMGHVASLLAPGGLLVLTVPAFQALWTGHDELNAHFRRYTAKEVARLASDAGLSVLHRGYFFNSLALPKLAAATLERLRPRPPAHPSLRFGALNELVRRWCLLEQRTWGRLPLPFGSSALLVARAPRHVGG